MTGLHRFAPRAARDTEEAAAWFTGTQGGAPLARRFLAAVIGAADRAVRRPLLGHRRLELLPDPFRFLRVPGFPYLLVYDALREEPVVLRVLHMARDLGPLLADLDLPPDSEREDPL